jgi:hypothetical protein
VPRIVDEQMSAALGDVDEPTLRIFAASCAERSVQVFCSFRTRAADRADDVVFVVETVADLWDLGVGAAAFRRRSARLRRFPELRVPVDPGGELPETLADEMSVFSLAVLEAAVTCARRPSAEAARDCAHISLTAMDRFGYGPALEAERVRQAEVADLLRTGTELKGIRHGDQAVGRAIAAQVLSEEE